MKKRIIVLLLAVLVAFSLFPMDSYAYECEFPFDEFLMENKDLNLSFTVEFDGIDEPPYFTRSKLLTQQLITYEGCYSDYSRRPVFTQKALVKIALPEDFFWVKENPLNSKYTKSCWESGYFFKYYDIDQSMLGVKSNLNDIEWSITHKISDSSMGCYSYEKYRSGKTFEEVIEESLEEERKWSIDFRDSYNVYKDITDNPEQIIRYDDGFLIIKECKLDFSEDISTSGCKDTPVIKEGIKCKREYTRLYTSEEMPGFIFSIKFEQTYVFKALVSSPGNTEYKEVYEEGKKRIEEYEALHVGEKMTDIASLISITWKEPVITDAYVPVKKASKPDKEDKKKDEVKPIHESVEQDAKKDQGEDGGVTVPAAIVVGAIGAAGAVGGAAAAGGFSDGAKSQEAADDERRKKYKMYVQKDFGDCIKRGGDTVVIRARMAEVDENGVERDRDDLTQKIKHISSNGLELHRASVSGRYMEADVSVPEKCEEDKVSITFTFEGEGGTFSNTINFRVTGNPKLSFLDDEGYETNRSYCDINAILGDGLVYTEQFFIGDAVKIPEVSCIAVTQAADGIEVTFEKTESAGVFKANVINSTTPAEDSPYPTFRAFRQKEQRKVEFSVEVEDEKEPLTGQIYLNLYPEGITVESDKIVLDEECGDTKYITVRSYEKEAGTYGGLDSKWESSRMTFHLAVVEEGKAIIDPDDLEFTFDKLIPNSGIWLDKYKYDIDKVMLSGRWSYYFEPNTYLCEPLDGTQYRILLPASCEYAGKTYKEEVSLRLMGQGLEKMDEWEIEYSKLKDRIEKFSLEGEKSEWLKRLDSIALEPRSSKEELRLVSKLLVSRYVNYWTHQSKVDMRDVKFYNVLVSTLEWTKFAGDCAFSLLINAYAGPVADAIISPAKDFFTGAIGEIIAADKLDMEVFKKFEFSKSLATAGDNIMGNNIKLTDVKTAAATLGAYFVYSAFKNYVTKLEEDNESDMWGALTSAFSDMTINVIKSKAGDLLGEWLEEDNFKKHIAPKINKYFKEVKFSNLAQQYNEWQQLYGDLAFKGAKTDATVALTDIVSKYATDLLGEGCGWVSGLIDDVADTGFKIQGDKLLFVVDVTLSEKAKFAINIDIMRTLRNVSCPLFGFLYDLAFGEIPFATATIDIPKDPPICADSI